MIFTVLDAPTRSTSALTRACSARIESGGFTRSGLWGILSALIRFEERDDAEGLFSGHRVRVITRVESGASRREAAEHFEVSASTAVIWVKNFREARRCAAKPRGESVSPLEEHGEFLLALIDEQPDLTLDEWFVPSLRPVI
jgi:hypothetical protein